jgi:hypothetical protein
LLLKVRKDCLQAGCADYIRDGFARRFIVARPRFIG